VGIKLNTQFFYACFSLQDINLMEMGSTTQVVEDDDVRAERDRINGCQDSDLIRTNKVVLRELTKFYNGTFLAVDRLSLGIPEGECFGLLGVNGAGKTTTFKMMTGDETLSAGNATLDGISVRQNVQGARERVGYCPQFDALIDQMTVTETLWMYARLRGVAEADIKNLVEKTIEQLTLKKHAAKQAKNLR
jgi:ATP-binding cassette subfamily A (ABC1) protein 3